MAFVCRGAGWGGGGGRAPRPPFVRPGGGLKGGGSLCLVPSLCLPWAGNKAGVTGVVLSMGGVAPQTTPVRARPPSLGAICAASWRVGAGSLVLRGCCGSRRLRRGGGSRSGSSLGRGGGDHPPCLGGWAPGPLRRAGRWRGWGGGVAPRPPCSPSGWRPAVPHPGPPHAVGALPSGVRVRSGSQSRPGLGGDEGRPVDQSPGDPSALPEWAVVMWGAASILFWCAVVRRPQAWCARCSGTLVWARPAAATPAGAGGWGRWGARCAGPAASPPPRRGPFWGRGGVPSAPGGRRIAPVAPKRGGGSGGGGGAGGPPPRPPTPSGVGLPSVVSGVPPRGILVPWGLPGGRGRRARSGRPPTGQCGGGGGGPPRPGSRPRLPRAGL